jgi:hypothetical protein
MGVVVFTSIYFIQLIYNFRNYLSITNIKYKVFIIIISYILIYLSEMNAEALKGSTFSANHYFKIVLGLLFLFMIIVNVNLLIQYGILGYRLLQKKELPDVKNIGFTFLYLIPISFVGIVICVAAGMKDFAQIFIIFELLPYWFSYKIYRELIVSENQN